MYTHRFNLIFEKYKLEATGADELQFLKDVMVMQNDSHTFYIPFGECWDVLMKCLIHAYEYIHNDPLYKP